MTWFENNAKQARAKSVPVDQLDKRGNFIHRFESLQAAAIAVAGLRSGIWVCCKGKAKTAYGFKWQYACN